MSSIKEQPRGGGFVPPGHADGGGPPGRSRALETGSSPPIVANPGATQPTSANTGVVGPNVPPQTQQTPQGPNGRPSGPQGGPNGPQGGASTQGSTGAGSPPPTSSSTPVESPRDVYRDTPAYESPAADTGLRGQAPTYKRPVTELAPNLNKVRELPDVPDRFASDYQMVAKEVVDVPDTASPEKAQRAFEYFTKYAERFVELAQKPKPEVEEKAPPEGAPVDAELSAEEVPADFLPETQVPEDGKKLKDPRGKEGELKKLPTGEQLPEGELPPGEFDGEVLVKQPKGEGEGKKKSRLEQLVEQAPLKPREGEGQTRDAKGSKDSSWFNPKRAPDEAGAPLRKEAPGRPYSETEKKASAQEFVSTLADLGFDQIHDEKTGQTGLEKAYELLMSRSLKELQQKAQQTRMTAENWPPPPPQPKSEELVKEQAKKGAANEFTGAPLLYKEIGESSAKLSHRQAQDPLKDGVELRVNTLAADGAKILVNARDQRELRNDGMQNDADPRRDRRGKLGNNMLWNVLHKMRGQGEDSTIEQAKWDRMAFGAVLFMVTVTLIAIVLISM